MKTAEYEKLENLIESAIQAGRNVEISCFAPDTYREIARIGSIDETVDAYHAILDELWKQFYAMKYSHV